MLALFEDIIGQQYCYNKIVIMWLYILMLLVDITVFIYIIY